MAFKDVALTDVFYSKLQNANRKYTGPLILVDAANHSPAEIQFLLQHIKEGHPKVLGIDLLFPESDALSFVPAETNKGVVIPIVATSTAPEDSSESDQTHVGKLSTAFINFPEQDELITVRSFFPFYKSNPSFSTVVVQNFDASLATPLKKSSNKPMQIRYWGNAQTFTHYNFEEVMSAEFDVSLFNKKIILIGNLGLDGNGGTDGLGPLYYTPMNEHLSGRTQPDMNRLVVHANIIRMVLDKDYIKTVPAWLSWLAAFFISWMLVPVFTKWYVFKPMWSHFLTKCIQLAVVILLMYLIVLLYAEANVALEPAPVLVSIILLGDLVLFYDGLVKYLKFKKGFHFHSIFFEGH